MNNTLAPDEVLGDPVQAPQQAAQAVQAAPQNTQASQLNDDEVLGDPVQQSTQGPLARAAGSFGESFGIPRDVTKIPETVENLATGPIGNQPHLVNIPINLAKGLVTSSGQASELGLERMKQPGIVNKLAGALEYVEGGVPFIGPALVGAGRQMESGDIAGGLGTTAGVASQLAIPHIEETALNTIDRIKNLKAFQSDSEALATASSRHQAASTSLDQRSAEHQTAIKNSVAATKHVEDLKGSWESTKQQVEDAENAASAAAANVTKATKALVDAQEAKAAAAVDVDKMNRKIQKSKSKIDEKQTKKIAGAKEDFQKAIPSAPKGPAAYTDKDYLVGRAYLENHHQNVQEVNTVQDAYDAFDHIQHSMENQVQPYVKKYGNEPISTNVRMDVRDALADNPRQDFVEKGMQGLESYNLIDPTVSEADEIRAQLNAENRATLKKNMWDVATALRVDPEFAARYAAADSIRDGIYDTLENKGVQGVRELRQDEASIIKLRNAAEKQLTKGDVRVRGSGQSGAIRQMASKGAVYAGTAAGVGIGATTGMPGAPEAGGIIGGYAGKKLGAAIAPGDLTRNDLMTRSMKVKGGGVPTTEVQGPGTAPSQFMGPGAIQRDLTPLHGELATHYGENVIDSGYTDLEQRFKEDIQDKRRNGVPLEPAEKALLGKINQQDAADALKARQEAQEAAARGESQVPVATLPNDAEPLLHPPVAKFAEGMDTERGIVHDLAHIIVGSERGIDFRDGVRSHLHGENTSSGALMSAPIDWDKFTDEDGEIDLNKIKPKIADIAATYVAGGVANDLYHDIPFTENHHLGADVRVLKSFLKNTGFTEEQASKMIAQAVDDAAQVLSRPGVREMLESHAAVREPNLDVRYHVSPERVNQILADIKGTDVVPKENEVEDEATTGEPTTANAAGGGKNEGTGTEGKVEPEKGNSAELRSTGQGPTKGKGGSTEGTATGNEPAERDDLADEALKIINEKFKGKASTSGIQRELKVGYGRAARIIDQLRASGELNPKLIEAEQGGHAGGEVASEEELNRPGRFVKISRSGQPTDQGKVPDFNLREGEAGYQVKPDGTYELKSGQETPSTKRGVENYAKEVFSKKNLSPQLSAIAEKKSLDEHDLRDAANEFNAQHGRPPINTNPVTEDPRSSRIADSYKNAVHAPNDPAVKASYDALKRDIDQQYDLAKSLGIKMDVKDENPYGLSTTVPAHEELHNDIRNNKHLTVWSGGKPPVDHPMSEIDPKTGLIYNDKFRMVHDIFGHAAERTDFSPNGEETAWNLHRQMFSPEARPALATDTRGQAAYTYKYGDFPPQKAALLPEEHQVRPEDLPHWSDKIASNLDKQPAGGINPNNPNAESKRYGFEILPEARQALENNPTAEQFKQYAETHQGEINSHPDIKLGWDTTGPKPELNIGAATNDLEKAKQMAAKLDQRDLWDNKEEKTIPVGGTGTKTEFPEYPFEQRLNDLSPQLSSKQNAKDVLDRIAEEYGKSSDASKVQHGASFIHPDGKFSHLGTDDHQQVMFKHGFDAGTDDDRVPFINNSGAVRTNSWTGRQGRTLSFSVPNTGVTPEQIDSMKRAVVPYRSNGQVRIETADTPTQVRSQIKDFPTGNDVEPMLRQIGAHPETKSPTKPSWWNEPSDNAFAKGMTKGEEVTDWLDRHKPQQENGKYVLYHATPVEGGAENSIKAGSLLAEDSETALHQASRERGPKSGGIKVGKVLVNPEDIKPGIWASVRNDHPVSEWSNPQPAQKFLQNSNDMFRAELKQELGITGDDPRNGLPNKILAKQLTAQRAKQALNPQLGPRGSSVPLMTNPLKIEGTGEEGKVNTLDVAKALNQYTKNKIGALELKESDDKTMTDRAKKLMEDEARYQIAQNGVSKEWYTTQMANHDKYMQELRPELNSEEKNSIGTPVKTSLFKFAEAIVSAGSEPHGNVNTAVNAWDHYNETGQFSPVNPETGKSWGRYAAEAYGNAFNSLNKLIAEKGEKGASDWLLSEHPVSELRQYMTPSQTPVSGKATDMQPGAMILGAKRGPFALNLHGLESAFTADMWVARSWNRWMGTIETGTDPKRGDILVSDSPRNNTERTLMKQSFEHVANKLGLTTSSLQAVLWYYEKALYDAHGSSNPEKYSDFSDAAKRVLEERKTKESDTDFNFGKNVEPQPKSPKVENPSGGIHGLNFLSALGAK
jgi:hypothetical protein